MYEHEHPDDPEYDQERHGGRNGNVNRWDITDSSVLHKDKGFIDYALYHAPDSGRGKS